MFHAHDLVPQVVKDIELLAMILVLVLVDLLMLVVQEGVDPIEVTTYNTSTRVR